MREGMDQPGRRLLTAPEKVWVGTKNVIFCSGYNAPFLFLNLNEVFSVQRA